MNSPSTRRPHHSRTRSSVETRADELMADTQWDWLRSRAARRTIVVVLAVSLAATALLFVAAGSWGFVPLVGFGVAWLALRIAVRSVADLPDDLLDERQVGIRDRAFKTSFFLFGAIVMTGLAGGFAWVVASAQADEATLLAIDENDAFGVVWFSLGLYMTLPSMAVAWASEQV